MNRQSVFDTILAHSRVMPAKCGVYQIQLGRETELKCLYRLPQDNGQPDNRCFIGRLIPDEDYSEQMEGSLFDLVTTAHSLGLKWDWLPGRAQLPQDCADMEFLEKLQLIHDTEAPESWEPLLELFAATYGLTYTPPLEAA